MRRRLSILTLLSLLLLPALPQGKVMAQAEAVRSDLEARTFEIADKLRCPVCVSESVAQSNSTISIQMRQIIQDQLGEGRSEQEILSYFRERYGDWILQEPPKRGLHLLVWLLPIAVALAGVVVLTLLMRRWVRASREPLEVEESDLARVRDELIERNPR